MGDFIGAAMRSIDQQRSVDMEILVADAQSSDETLEVLDSHRRAGLPICLLQVDHASTPAIARNAALKQASGELVGFLDADDLWPQGKLDRQLAFLDAHPDMGMVSGYVRYFEQPDATGLEPAPSSRTQDIFHVHLGACIYRRSSLEKIGPFDPDLRYGEDMDLLLRFREAGINFAILRSIELYYRKHGASLMAQNDPRKQSDFRLATLKSLRRRRESGKLAELRDFSTYVVP